MDELLSYINRLNENETTFALPKLYTGQSIFSINTVYHAIEKDMASLTFKIPLANVAEFTEYVIISVPNNNMNATKLANNKFIHRIILNKMNNSYFEPPSEINKFGRFYESFETRAVDVCTSSIITNSESPQTRCTSDQWKETLDRSYVEINEDKAFIMTSEAFTLTIRCSEKETANNVTCPPFA